MANEWLFWLTGVVFVLVGVLTAVYLVYLQLRRGATGHSILSTSDTLALVVIGIMFIVNRMNVANFNTELKHYSETLTIKRQFGSALNEECSYRKVLLGYALFLVPFLNAFVSMIAQTSECYFNIKSRALHDEKSSGSKSTTVATKTINVQEAKSPPKGKSLEQLRVPTLISEMDLVVNKVSCVASDCVLDSQPSTSAGVKDPANLFLIPESKTPSEADDKEFKNIITVPTSCDKLNHGEPNMVIRSLRNLRSIKRLGLSVFGQWAIPLLGISVLLLSNMDEHSMETLRRSDSTDAICYVDNTLASGLKVSQECLENAYQEAYIKTLIGQHEKQDSKKLDMIRQYAATKNNTEIDHLTSMIINKIYGHVDEFNKTEEKDQYAFKSSSFQVPIIRRQRQASVSSFLKNLPKKNGTTSQEIKPKQPTASTTRFHTKPSFKSDSPRRKTPSNRTRLENREAIEDANPDDERDEAAYYDELPVDYVQPNEENSAEENDDKRNGAASSEERPGADDSKSEETETESNTTSNGGSVTPPAADKEQENRPQNDLSSSENSTSPDNENLNPATESVTQRPAVTTPIRTTFAPPSTTLQSEEVTDEHVEEQVEDINANAATSLPNFVTVTKSTEPPVVSSPPTPSSVENHDPMKDVNVCVKSCFISNNFLKGYLFVLLFVGYFLPITVAVVIYIVTIKHINSSEPQSSGIKHDAVLDVNGKEICSSMECIAKIVKQFILINVVMWTPTFLESLLRTWFCVNSPEWVVLLLFFLGQAHGIIRNMLNVKLVQTDSRGRANGESLWLGSHRKNDGTIHPTLPVPAANMSKSDQDKLFVKTRIAKLFKLDKK